MLIRSQPHVITGVFYPLLYFLIKVVQSLLETVGIALGFHGRSSPLFVEIRTSWWQRLTSNDCFDIIFDVCGFVFARIPSQRQAGSSIQKKLFKVSLNSADTLGIPASLLKPSPERMRSRPQKIDLVCQSSGRIDAVSILRCQLETNQLRGIRFVIPLVRW